MDNKDLLIEMMAKQNANLTALVQTLTESNLHSSNTTPMLPRLIYVME